jgi:formate/nitrite transporter
MDTHVEPTIDALLPPAMAAKAEEIGVKKANAPAPNLLVLGMLAGAFISLGAVFATTVGAGTFALTAPDGGVWRASLPYGLQRLAQGGVFTLGLILVVVGGAELFTGNTLITMAFVRGRVTLAALLRNWGIVYAGNLIGALATAGLVFVSGQWTFGNGAVGLAALNAAEHKTELGLVEAVALGILCNALVCMAVWLTYSARSTTDRILAVVPPISAFVAVGFEHSIANMYYIPIGLLIKFLAPSEFFSQIGRTAADYPHLTLSNFVFVNLLPVTVGNIIGGAVMVGLVYWFVYLRRTD